MSNRLIRKIPVLSVSALAVFTLASCGGSSDSGGAGAGAACYTVQPGGTESFEWPGGIGPERRELHNNATCSDPSGAVVEFVVAANQQQAIDRCAGNDAAQFDTDPPVDGSVSFFSCR
jgi:hypothetical protein